MRLNATTAITWVIAVSAFGLGKATYTSAADREARLAAQIQQLQQLTTVDCRYTIHKEVIDSLDNHRAYVDALFGLNSSSKDAPRTKELTDSESTLLSLTQDIVCGPDPRSASRGTHLTESHKGKYQGKGEARPVREVPYGYDRDPIPEKSRPLRPAWLRVQRPQIIDIDQPIARLRTTMQNLRVGDAPTRALAAAHTVARQAPTFLAEFLHGMMAFLVI